MTELIWDGKYKDGKKVPPRRILLPFQTVETVNESAAQRQHTLDLFASGKPTEWRNRLIWGDKSYVLPSLLPEFAGKVNLIYIDPPFDTGANFSYLATIPDAPTEAHGSPRKPTKAKVYSTGDDDEDDSETSPATGVASGLSFVKEPSVIEQKAYRDTWGKGLDSYLKWFYETVVLLRELLADNGSLYVHLDWHVGHYAKAVLDEVFGIDNFRNEIVWRYSGWNKKLIAGFEKRHDVIMLYSKTATPIFNSYAEPWKSAEEYVRIRKQKLLTETGGRQYVMSDAGGGKRVKRYLDEALAEGRVVDDAWLLDKVNNSAIEGLNYPTQKPEALLERIIKASSNPGDLVLDCFCGSGTTAAVAEKLGRRWITCDLGRFAIHTARKRFLAIDNVKPFVVQNLGKYERQQWQRAEFGEAGSPPAPILGSNTEGLAASPSPKSGSPLKSGTPELGRGGYAERERAYREFILSLYSAKPIHGYLWLHGVKNGHMVHVGSVDAPISVQDVAQAVAEFKRSRGTGENAPTQNRIDILGWDFAFELNEVSKQQAAAAGVEVKFVRIPREVLEKKAVEQGDIKFFELAALSVGVQASGKGIILTLKDFVIPLDDVPQEIQAAITHWEQWIDYWAVDWDNKGDTFHNQWQSYRTRKDKTIQRVIASPPGTYSQPGEYSVVVKVIDILGNDTTKTLKVQVK